MKVYEQWQYFPPDRLTFTGAREAGRMFHPLEFPPPYAEFSAISLDRVYGGPPLPTGGVCELIASYLTYMPNFGESIRVINLMRQCVTSEHVSQLFSASLTPRLPNLKSVSLRIFSTVLDAPMYEMFAPVRLEHLELCMNDSSVEVTQWILEPFLPLLRKVKHLAWYRCYSGEEYMTSIFPEPLESLKVFETNQEVLGQFRTYPIDVMPSLQRLIVHNYQFSYWVNLKQIYEDTGEPFSIEPHVLDIANIHVHAFCSTRAFLYLPNHALHLEQLQRNPNVREITLCVTIRWPWDVLKYEVLPILSTFNDLEEVTVRPIDIPPYVASKEEYALMGNLHEQFQLASVRLLIFEDAIVDTNIDPYIAFVRLFPKLDTLVNPPMQCFKDVQICKCLRRESLLCLRNLIVFQMHAKCINDVSRCVLRCKNLNAFLVNYADDEEWIPPLMNRLAKHRKLRHLCIIADTTPTMQVASPLPTRENIEELAAAWSNRDWISMFFIATQPVGGRISFISAIHHGHGTIKYKESHNAAFELILHSFPQFYTLFWRHVKPQRRDM